MTPVDFPESNKSFGAPEGFADSQILPIRAFEGVVRGGSLDGAPVVVTAWKPDAAELEVIKAGGPIFLSFIGGIPPHMPTVNFQSAINPS